MALPWALLLLGEVLAQDAATQDCLIPPVAPNVALGRTVTQSSTLNTLSLAANAVDGNTDTDWERGSCAHTEKELEPWWRVDLGRRHAVYAVTVTNRHDCCWESLLGAQVHVGDSLSDRGKRNPACGAILDTGPGSTSTVCCNGLPGRYVSIIIPGREDFLVLCEVEVTAQSCLPPPGAQNLALRRPAAQSSTAGQAGSAINAVDGNRDGNWRHGSCSQTEREPSPWWTVDLGRRRAVAAVVVRNRLDCCWHQLKGARVHVGDSLAGHGTDNPVCGTITDTGPGSTSTVCCRGLRGRYVTIAVPGREERLSLCEVEVVEQGCAALPGAENVALGPPGGQSPPEPWWRVDLGRRHTVYAVVVKNRHDCCWERLKGAEVRVGDSLIDRGRRNPVCGIITNAGPGSLSTICCHGLRGRYVSILLSDQEDALVLCEVEVIRQGCAPLPGAANVAREQRATQSSTSNGSGVASKAVDGNRDGVWRHGSCSHTRREWEPWWSVDLGGRRAVAAVVVKNRQDCCWQRLRGAQVHVGDAPAERSRDNPIPGRRVQDAGPGSLSTICCHGLPGRYVTVTVPGREEQLALCEVEVYGGGPEL
ncbi:PREDICTED: uncharacterized protein LOC104015857 [Nipponia nippon]|uniref:uncharacterized protein LOC104015857 n=1 Tax=Nipponia nippon TaxID=128390 RepID=UPI00051119DC|nr:PREDICTED: uncharacterized protein LOC104015857 [Nipponia nippon]